MATPLTAVATGGGALAVPSSLDGTLDAALGALLRHRVDAIALRPPGAARASVRRRAARLRSRRRRLRHAFGSSTLAAGLTAGGAHQWLLAGSDRTAAHVAEAPVADDAITAVVPEVPIDDAMAPGEHPGAPTAPAATATLGWTWEATAGLARDAADPGALFDGGRFHVFATTAAHCTDTGCADHAVPRFESEGLDVAGRLAGDAMPDRPAWVAADDRVIWAPAAARVGDRVVLWFAATSGRRADRGAKCLGAAVAPTAAGPFVPMAEPLHCTPGFWAIDPSPVVTDDGLTLLWRQDDPAHHTGTIVSAPLRPDGLAVAGPPTTLLAGQHAWEDGYPSQPGGIGPIENPAMARHPETGEWLLTWSANRWETREYATGLAICDGPAGPCRRVGSDPWLRTSASPGFATAGELGGAGGLSFVTGRDGDLYAVLHAYAGTGAHPSPRVGWAYRVEAAGPAGYRLADIVRNQPAPSSVNVP